MVRSAHPVPIYCTPDYHPHGGGLVAGVAGVTGVKVAGVAFGDFLNSG